LPVCFKGWLEVLKRGRHVGSVDETLSKKLGQVASLLVHIQAEAKDLGIDLADAQVRYVAHSRDREREIKVDKILIGWRCASRTQVR
jgi:hypothetical protein